MPKINNRNITVRLFAVLSEEIRRLH